MTDVVLISDLHLGPGYDSARGAWDPLEPFFYDGAFARFIDHLLTTARREGRSLRLVILGDLLDLRLLHPALAPHGGLGASSTETASAAVATIARGHPGVFAALGRLLSAGCDLDIVVGNHDVELASSAVQTTLREALPSRGEGEPAGTLRFHPWIFYVPGLLYAEHGHQYQRLEALATVLTPDRRGDGDSFEATVAAFVYKYLLRLDISIDPCPDHETPPWRYFRLVARRHPAAVLATLPRYARLVPALVQHTAELSASEARARHAYTRTLTAYASALGLPEEVVRELDALSPASSASATTRLARSVAEPTAAALGALAAISLVATRTGRSRTLALGASAASGLALASQRRLRSSHPATASYLHRAALSVHRVLARHGCDVPAYVFAHNHQPQHLPLEMGPAGAQYLNTGTWSSLVATPRQPLGSPFRPTFVHVTEGPSGGPPSARLLFWNDAAGTTEPIRSQA